MLLDVRDDLGASSEALYRQALAIAPSDPELHYNLGQ